MYVISQWVYVYHVNMKTKCTCLQLPDCDVPVLAWQPRWAANILSVTDKDQHMHVMILLTICYFKLEATSCKDYIYTGPIVGGENWMSGVHNNCCQQYNIFPVPMYAWQEDLNWLSVGTTRLLTVESLLQLLREFQSVLINTFLSIWQFWLF